MTHSPSIPFSDSSPAARARRPMKSSGVPWIGEIPAGWKVIKLKYCSKILNGFPFESGKFSNANGFPLIRIRDITSGTIETFFNGEFDEAYVVSDGDVLVGMDGDFNVRWWKSGKALLNQRCCKISACCHLVLRYLYYCLPLLLERINQLTYATTVKHLSAFDIADSYVPFISEKEQHRIAAHLDAQCARIDSIIEKTRASIEEYKKLKQSVITEAVTKGIRKGRAMKESGIEWIGKIPEEWNIVPLKRIASIQTGNTPPKSENSTYYSPESGCLWIKAEDLGRLEPIQKTTEYLTEEGIKCARIFPPNTVFVCCIASIGKVGFCNTSASCNQQINGMVFHDAYWKYGLYVTIAQEEEYLVNASGNVVKILNSEKQASLLCPLPPLGEQRAIADYLDVICAEIDAMVLKKERLISALETYKKSLIYETVTGKKEVPA